MAIINLIRKVQKRNDECLPNHQGTKPHQFSFFYQVRRVFFICFLFFLISSAKDTAKGSEIDSEFDTSEATISREISLDEKIKHNDKEMSKLSISLHKNFRRKISVSGSVAGHHVIIVDDMIDTGHTLKNAVEVISRNFSATNFDFAKIVHFSFFRSSKNLVPRDAMFWPRMVFFRANQCRFYVPIAISFTKLSSQTPFLKPRAKTSLKTWYMSLTLVVSLMFLKITTLLST